MTRKNAVIKKARKTGRMGNTMCTWRRRRNKSTRNLSKRRRKSKRSSGGRGKRERKECNGGEKRSGKTRPQKIFVFLFFSQWCNYGAGGQYLRQEENEVKVLARLPVFLCLGATRQPHRLPRVAAGARIPSSGSGGVKGLTP